MNVPRIAGLLALAAASALAGGCASDARIQADAKAMTLNAELISRQHRHECSALLRRHSAQLLDWCQVAHVTTALSPR